MRLQRLIQIPFFLFFLLLLFLAAFPLPRWADVSLFLKLDPIIALGSMATARTWIPGVAWFLGTIVLALILGRVFCGYVCPMGTTVDLADWIGRRSRRRKSKGAEATAGSRTWKYLVLLALAGSALMGVGYHFLFSPLSMITRFYGLVLYPVLSLLGSALLSALRPVFSLVGLEGLSFVEISVPYYSTNLFMAALVLAVLLLGLLQPRFWCRNLCPAGAILGLFSWRPWFRRSVSDKCNRCGRCRRSCPTGAIQEDFTQARHSECITCLKCQEVCPEKAISFTHKRGVASSPLDTGLSRRGFITAAVSGAAFSAVSMTNLGHLHGGLDPRPLRAPTLIRPPGALPEPQFQARCVRCGECVKGCLTNTLQLVWAEAGISGLWTPKITPRQGGCEQNCNLCGHVCPTGAIRPLSMEEKPFAKIGTARIITSRCIAWEQNKRCLICDEICPYNAISSQFAAGHTVTVPVIDEDKCNGCGFCENKCPVQGEAAVVVEPLGEVRLAQGSYREKAEELGLVFHARSRVEDEFILNTPGAEGEGARQAPAPQSAGEGSSLPPGFVTD